MLKSIIQHKIVKVKNQQADAEEDDHIVVEEPLEILVNYVDQEKKFDPLLVTMRTPGDDKDLVVGILFSNGIMHSKAQLLQFQYLESSDVKTKVLISISGERKNLNQAGYINSSCGVCNFETWEDVQQHSAYPILDSSFSVSKSTLFSAISSVNESHDVFMQTGGNHKVSILNEEGHCILTAEDVGRHNAFDKIIGKAILSAGMPLADTIALLSGRCSFEMCQKAWLAGIPIIASLGAPTSKAIALAEDVGITLIGFLKSNSFNIYSHSYRIKDERQ